MNSISLVMVGAPRSGTYWLVDLLQSRFRVHFPSETHFIPLYARYLWLWGDLSQVTNRRRLLGDIYAFLQIWTARSSASADYLEQIRRLSLLVTLDAQCAERIVAESHDYPSLVAALFRHFATLHGAAASGDKSAYYQVINPRLVLDMFPAAKMLHVVRDGRDVALSWTQQWFGPKTMREAARLWSNHVQVNRDWGRRNPARYLEIRYEDLAINTEAEIAKLQSFLRMPALAEDEGSGSDLAKALSNTESHSSMLDMVARDNVGKWKKEMSAKEVEQFESLAGAVLEASGYPVSIAGRAAARIQFPQLSLHVMRVLAKAILPLVLGVTTRLGLSVLPWINRSYPLDWQKVNLPSPEKT